MTDRGDRRAPPQVLRDYLASARRQGDGFAEAWPGALRGALAAAPDAKAAREWSEVLGETVEAWRSGWERRPVTGTARAFVLLADNSDREPLPLDGDNAPCGRQCEHCSGPIPDDRDPRTRYCCDRCRKTAHYTRSHPVAA